MPHQRAAELGTAIEACEAAAKADKDYAIRVGKIEVEATERLAKIAVDEANKNTAIWKQKAEDAEALIKNGSPFYERPVFVASVTAVLTIGVTFLAVSALKAATD